jgi:hypothetical protein
MNKVAITSIERIQLWKWLRAPSCYSAEHTLLSYTVFFKGARCIQDWCQRHSMTTWIRWGSHASVYPSPMWSWIRCWSTPDSRKVEWKDQSRTDGWGNASYITRLLSPARMDYQTQCHHEISLPLISITRLLLSATRSNKTYNSRPEATLLHKLPYS